MKTKISLHSIKKGANPDLGKTKDPSKLGEKQIERLKQSEQIAQNTVKEAETIKEAEQTNKISINGIKKSNNSKKSSADIDEKKQKDEKETINNGKDTAKKEIKATYSRTDEKNDPLKIDTTKDIFSNYESNFKKEGRKIVKHIKKIKDLTIPKTRKGLILGLIGFTSLVIIGLYFVNPERYSLHYYKTSILYNFNKLSENKEVQPINKNIKDTIPEPNSLIEELKNNKENADIFKKLGYSFEIKTKIDDTGKEVYSFSGKTYTSKEALLKEISFIIDEYKKNKVIRFLNKTYKKNEISSENKEKKSFTGELIKDSAETQEKNIYSD